MAQFFSDNQIKRFLIQFARIFSNWYYQAGHDAVGNPILKRFPIMYGDQSRQVATVIANNTPNNLPSVPLITYWISGIEYDQSRTQEPYFIDKLNVRQRAVDPDTGEMLNTQGNAFTIQRVMPVPYKLRINLSLWTSNEQQKLDFFEQTAVLFNPSMEIQSTDNFVDWTSLSVLYQEGITWSSRSIPVGTSNPIDYMTWQFNIPIWLSSPIKVQKLGVIHKIIASIFKGSALSDMQDDDLLLGTREKITPYGYRLLWVGKNLQVLPNATALVPGNDSIKPLASVRVNTIVGENAFTTTDSCVGVEVGQVAAITGIDSVLRITSIAPGTGVNVITLDGTFGADLNPDEEVAFYPVETKNTELYWPAVLNAYGTIRPGISMITLEHPDLDTEIRGTIVVNALDNRLLDFEVDVDTLPANTLDPVDSVIDPQQKYPISPEHPDGGLPPAAVGQRYLLVNAISMASTFDPIDPSKVPPPWGEGIKANANDIIEYSPYTVNHTVAISVDGGQLIRLDSVYGLRVGYETIIDETAYGIVGIDEEQNIIDVGANATVGAGTTLTFTSPVPVWWVAFDSEAATDTQYVTNLKTQIQYRFVEENLGDDLNPTYTRLWVKSVEGFYEPGDWNIVI